jgi:hypothetical protein
MDNKKTFSEDEIAKYAELFLLIHHQLFCIQKQLGPGQSAWERWRFRSRHRYLRQLLKKLLEFNGGDNDGARESIKKDLKFIGTGKKGWSYVSAGEIDYLEGLLEGTSI